MKGYFEFQYPQAVRLDHSRWRHGMKIEDGLLPERAAVWGALKGRVRSASTDYTTLLCVPNVQTYWRAKNFKQCVLCVLS